MRNETTTKDLSKPVWEKYLFKNGKDYELALANKNGVLVFRDSIFDEQFDNHEGWEDLRTIWNKCSLKLRLEEWWEENAPNDLKDNYKITIPEAYNIFPDELLPRYLQGKNKQWEIYKNWRNRLFGHHERQETIIIWTKTKNWNRLWEMLVVYADGGLNNDYANRENGVVPCLIPIKRNERKE